MLAINVSVRLLGKSDAFPLSPFNLVNKSRALIALGRHAGTGTLQPTEKEIKLLLRQLAAQYRVPPGMALAVAEVESGFMPVRISSAGAMGLMQLMPGTAGDLGVPDPYDARENARGGVRYLSQLTLRYQGDIHRVAAAYNAGPENVPTSGPFRMSGATSAYVANVKQRYAFYQSLDSRR